jgi:ClpA/ClpB-like protein
VKGVWGRTPQLPRELHQIAAEKARQLGRRVVSDDLFLLAIAELPDDSLGRRALEAEALDSVAIRERIRTDGDNERGPGWLTYAPAFYSMQGRAEGFAAALGDGTITPEHVLLAILWDPMSLTSHLVRRMGGSREGILDHLREFGVPVPQAALPAQQSVEWGEKLWIERDQVQAVTSYLARRISPDTVWGFNYEGQQAWVDAESRVDLERLVAEALADADENR